jgi:ABC-type nitrate/sulfonate/bicarbonate transport system permease component
MSARSRRRRSKPSGLPLTGLLPLVAALAAWQAFGSKDSAYFPVPSEWARSLADLWQAGKVLPALGVTLLAFAVTLALSILIGTALGIAVGRSQFMDKLLGPLLEVGRTMPAGALVPMAVLILGDSLKMKLAVAVFTSMWPVLLNVRSGARQISMEKLEVARVFGMSKFATFTKVTLPSLTPNVLLGTQIAAPVALILVLLVEILTQVSGLGREIALAQSTYKAGLVYGLVVVVGALGLLVNWAIGKLSPFIGRFQTT